MKKTLTLLAIVACFSMSHAQETKFLLELGGSYTNKQNDQPPTGQLFYTSLKTIAPRLNVQLGYKITAHSYLGLNYQHRKTSLLQESRHTNSDFSSYNKIEEKVKNNAYGIFYRHYFLPIDKSRWNGFVELAPSLALQRTDNEKSKRTVNNTTSYTQEESFSNHFKKEKNLDTDLRIGGSYAISDNFMVQLSLHSLANITHTFEDSVFKETGEEKATSFQFLKSPLANTYLSLLFKI
ncbi:outer membrane beta-barrel protein [Sphingobacterium faecale]|uniref:Outer membrane beta-barrel protein n=1 Tax=Sphingobacterium faecale TaxID=2803775 RepID=A0ABS1R6C3_9SPHI|nr:outer membrane beta-barrel protein [Sphingobacterium faecale]MBL1409421.1 outer membrane beta-barrel protein [Sphingobacterium faecale]